MQSTGRPRPAPASRPPTVDAFFHYLQDDERTRAMASQLEHVLVMHGHPATVEVAAP